MKIYRRSSTMFFLLLLGLGACRPLSTAVPTVQSIEKGVQEQKKQGGSADGELEEALESSGIRVKEAEEANRLIKERKELEKEEKSLLDSISRSKAELAKTGLSAAKKKELDVAIEADEKVLKVIQNKLVTNAADLKKNLEKLLASENLPESLRQLLKELLDQISTLEGKGEDGGLAPASGGKPGPGAPGSPEAPKPSGDGQTGQNGVGGAGSVRLVLEANQGQCLSLSATLPRIGACQAESTFAAFGTNNVELRLENGDRCLSVRSPTNEPYVEKCNGSLVQKWNLRFRSSGNSFGIENALVTGAAREPLCLRGDAVSIILDKCTNAVTTFLKKAP